MSEISLLSKLQLKCIIESAVSTNLSGRELNDYITTQVRARMESQEKMTDVAGRVSELCCETVITNYVDYYRSQMKLSGTTTVIESAISILVTEINLLSNTADRQALFLRLIPICGQLAKLAAAYQKARSLNGVKPPVVAPVVTPPMTSTSPIQNHTSLCDPSVSAAIRSDARERMRAARLAAEQAPMQGKSQKPRNA